MKANKDTRKRLNGSTEPKGLEEERERLINQFLAEPGQLSLLIQTGVAQGALAAVRRE